MSDERISIFIDAHGSARLKTSGVDGSKCLDLSKAIEKELGTVQNSTEFTDEFYNREKERAVIIRQGGGQ
jgi:hypothetical protein